MGTFVFSIKIMQQNTINMLNENICNSFIASIYVISLTLKDLIQSNMGRRNPFPPFGFDEEHLITLQCRKCEYKEQN
jgi:hypothetical protein